MMGKKANYTPIGEESTGISSIEFANGETYQTQDPESQHLSINDFHITHMGSNSETSRKRMLWRIVGPALVLLVVLAVLVALVSQTPRSGGLPTNEIMTSREGASSPLNVPSMNPVFATAANNITDAIDTSTKGNANDTLSCLSEECDLLLKSLRGWKDLANVALMQCLANSALNKTNAGVCFKDAKPGEARDNLVACAGCNGCVKLKTKDNVDAACAKYKAWSDKKAAEADAVEVKETEEDDALPPAAESPASPIDSVLVEADNIADDIDDSTAAAKGNATNARQCLTDKCNPLLKSLGHAWSDLANIALLRCLADSALNKTTAGVCFKNAKPGEVRDNLVACAGCNGCVKLKTKENVDNACTKYKAWSDKKKAEADAAEVKETEEDDTTTPGSATTALSVEGIAMPTPEQADGLLAALPKELRESFCSKYWCP